MLEVFTVCVILMLCIYHFWKSSQCKSNFPGPTGIPFFGVFFQVELNRLHLKLNEWALIYGDAFKFSVFGKTYISLNSADLVRDVMGHEPNATIAASREPSFFGEYCMENYSDIAFAPNDREWMKRRKVGHQLLHTYGEGMHLLEDEILQKLTDMKQFIRENDEKDLDPHFMVEEFLFKNLASLIAGTTDGQLQRLMKEVDENSNDIVSPIVDLVFKTFPFLRFLPFPAARKPSIVKFCIDEMMKAIKKLTNDRNLEKGMYYELKNSKEMHDLHLTDRQIKGILANVVGAGFLTSRGTLMSLILLLAKHPNIQSRLQSEIDEAIGEREAHIKDRNNCPFTEAVILETLRYISHAPLAIPHYTSEDCNINGRTVGKGTSIITNLWTIHHSEEWGDPFVFRPERFLDDAGLLLPATHPIRKRLLVFGYGKRACVGEVFAKNRTFLFLATMMQICNIRKPSRGELSDLDPRVMMPGIVLQPLLYKVQFKLRGRAL